MSRKLDRACGNVCVVLLNVSSVCDCLRASHALFGRSKPTSHHLFCRGYMVGYRDDGYERRMKIMIFLLKMLSYHTF